MTPYRLLNVGDDLIQDREQLRKMLEEADSEYVVLSRIQDTFPPADVRAACIYAADQDLDAVMLECTYDVGRESAESDSDDEQEEKNSGDEDSDDSGDSDDGKSVTDAEGLVIHLDQLDELVTLPDDYEAVVYRRSTILSELPDADHGYEIAADLFYRIAEKKGVVGYLSGTNVVLGHPGKRDFIRNADDRKVDWYLGAFRKHWEKTIARYGEGELPVYVQRHLLRELTIRYDANRNRRNRQALSSEELEQFLELTQRILAGIQDEFLISGVKLWKKYNFTFALQDKFLNLKYENPKIEYLLVDSENEQNSGFSGEENWPTRIRINGRVLPNQLIPKVYIDVMNEEEDSLVLECASPKFLQESDVHWTVLLNGKSVPYQETERYKDTRFFGMEPYHQFTFRVELKKKDFKKHNQLQFVLNVNGKNVPHPMATTRFPARISTKLNRAYWCFDKYLATFNMGGTKTTLYIKESSWLTKLFSELLFLREIKKGRAARPDLIKERLWYWLTYPIYHRKNIWITFDKLYKGGDNGEYFYKYCTTRKDTDIVPVYVINQDAEDLERLRHEGYQPVIHGSRKHRCMFLHSKMIFATHAALYKFNAVPQADVPYVQDLLHATAVYISHGLSVQNLVEANNQAQNNMQLYYCASKYEVQNLLQPAYGYQGKNIVRLKGLARFDGLVNNDQKQILITPTWRNYIALTPDNPNESRPYSSLFRETDYYKIFNSLINDDKLLRSAKENGYRIIYLVHPNIAEQAVDFEQQDGVEVISALDANYEKLLCESSLMVTDYSGVQFDFAYMRKPIVYYHPPKLPPHYEDGGFFYDTQGFGEICEEQDHLVDLLCDYMEHRCELKNFYRERQDDYLAFDDHNNCQRIFEDAYQWQKAKRK